MLLLKYIVFLDYAINSLRVNVLYTGHQEQKKTKTLKKKQKQ